MREFRVSLITALLVGVVVIAHDPARVALLTVLTFPLTVVKAGARLLVALPRLPSLAQENASLREELMQRQAESAQLRELVRQSRQADALLAHGGRADAVVAGVIGRSTVPTQHTVLLNRGARDGLTLDSVIVDAAGVIGRVMEVHDRTCLVMLLTSSIGKPLVVRAITFRRSSSSSSKIRYTRRFLQITSSRRTMLG